MVYRNDELETVGKNSAILLLQAMKRKKVGFFGRKQLRPLKKNVSSSEPGH